MDIVDGNRIALATAALDKFTNQSLGNDFRKLLPEDRADALFDLLTALMSSPMKIQHSTGTSRKSASETSIPTVRRSLHLRPRRS